MYITKLNGLVLTEDYVEDELLICEAIRKNNKLTEEMVEALSRLRSSINSELKKVVKELLE